MAVVLKKIPTVFGLLIALPILLLVRVIRPIVLIRFGPLTSQRIGHFAGNTGLYLNEHNAGLHGRKSIDFFFHQKDISNTQLKKMWDRTLRVTGLARYLALANKLVPNGKPHNIPMDRYRDIDGFYADTPQLLSFDSDEKQQGKVGLRDIGIPNDTPFVCVLARDSSYLESSQSRGEGAWKYQDYRDSSIHNYLPAAEELVRRGNYAIRVGAIVNTPFESQIPGVIDYANNGRNDFMDIYLTANCHFYLGDTAGLFEVSRLFHRPVAWVNFVPLEGIFAFEKRGLVIPKRLWLRQESRYMTFREAIKSGASRFFRGNQYEELGIDVIENTPQEITSLAVEMDERLKGTWQTTAEDDELQQRFWDLFEPSKLVNDKTAYANRAFLARIGAEFLRENQELLN